jgi:hypothetical protein
LSGKVIIIFFLSFISIFSSYSNRFINNSTTPVVNEPQIIADGILYSYLYDSSGFSFLYLTQEKKICYGRFPIEDKLILNDISEIYKYEKEDIVTYMDIFSYKDTTYIFHLEKFSYELIMNYFSDLNNIKKYKIADSTSAPFVFNKDHFFYFFFIDTLNNLSFKKFDIDKYKFIDSSNIKNIDTFSIYKNEMTDNFLSLWKIKNEPKNIYISAMDLNLKGLSDIIQLKFKQKTILPFSSIINENINLIFKNDFQNCYLTFPVNSDVRNSISEVLPEIFKDYDLKDYFSIDDVNIILFNKTTANNNQKIDEIKIGFFDTDFKLIYNINLKGINGSVSNFKCNLIGNKLYIFWIEKLAGSSSIKCSIINFN